MKTDLLDHGYIRLVSYTQPAERVMEVTGAWIRDPNWSGDLEIVRAARVSYNADWRPPDLKDTQDYNQLLPEERPTSKDERLIHYLWSHQHTSPFEAMSFSFEVQAPIFVFRQWHRHRTQSYNEVSARYTELPNLFYVPALEQIREQSKSNKQGRGDVVNSPVNQQWIRNRIQTTCEDAHADYQTMLQMGLARELARLVLPVNTYSRMYASANLLNWFRFLTLRTDPHAQYEIRVYAAAMVEMIERVCPIAVAAWKASVEKADDEKA